jgi:hypothetical protein
MDHTNSRSSIPGYPDRVVDWRNGIKNAIADDQLINTAGTTPAPPPDNYSMVDATVNVSLSTPGDVFKGTDKGITTQFINLTPDTLGITALSPNTFIKTDVGDDTIAVTGGHNIISAGAGGNSLTGSTTGADTFLSDVATGNVITAITNFHSGDNAGITGLSLTDFQLTLKDVTGGLEIDATPLTAGKNTALLILQGFKHD